MHAFDILGDPVRRRILELLADGERQSGAVVEVIQTEFGITQSAVSQHLAKFKAHGLVTVRRENQTLFYRLAERPDVKMLRKLGLAGIEKE